MRLEHRCCSASSDETTRHRSSRFGKLLVERAIESESTVCSICFVAPFDDLESALKRLNTLKELVSRYQSLFSPKTDLLVSVSSFNGLKQTKSSFGFSRNSRAERNSRLETSKVRCRRCRSNFSSMKPHFRSFRFVQRLGADKNEHRSLHR